MSYENFQKNGVDYSLFYGVHLFSSYPIIKANGGLKSLDVLVVETGYYADKGPFRFISDAARHPQYKEIIRAIPKENPDLILYDIDVAPTSNGFYMSMAGFFVCNVLPLIYGFKKLKEAQTEKETKKNLTRRGALKRMLGWTSVAFGTSLGISGIQGYTKSEEVDAISTVNSVNGSMLPNPLLGFRNSVAAKIIEEYVIPAEKTRDGLRIGILYGAAHTGIEENLKYKSLRDTTISAYKRFGYPGVKLNDLNTIRRFRWSSGWGGVWFEDTLRLDLF